MLGMLGMLRCGVIASYYIESVFIELINNERIKSRKTQNGSFQDIQARHWVENETFGADLPRLEQKYPKQNGRIIASEAEPQKGKSSESVGFNSERDGKYESESNRRNAESAEKSQKGAERDFDRFAPLDSTPSRVAAAWIAQNSTGPVDLVRCRLDISNYSGHIA